MKAGITVQQLATCVQAQIAAKRDLIVNTKNLHFEVGTDGVITTVVEYAKEANELKPREERFLPTELFLRQVASRLEIPQKYFARMREDAPDLLAENLRHWCYNEPENRMVRTLTGTGDDWNVSRAFLSDKYKRLDNEDVIAQVLPALAQIPGLQILQCELTETRMYIKAVTPKITGEVKKGDAVQAGVILSNSEVGGGALNVSPLVYRLVCLNGMILPDHRFRAFHVGKRADGEEAVYEMLTDETRQADDKAILLKARDVANGIFNQDYFNALLEPMRVAADTLVPTARPDKAVEVLAKKIGMSEGEQISVLTHLLQGGDLSVWGFANAVTRAAQDVESYDRSVQLEQVGGDLINLDKKDWSVIAQAA